MRKASNVLVGILAAGVCAVMVWISAGAGLYTMIYNLAFLAVMLLIILLGWVFGFRRMRQTVKGMDRASKKLMSIYMNKENKAELLEMTRAGAQIFEVEYLDHKYQEYLGYLRKTNSPCDIGDYIGEYEINNYTHRRLLEMIPDILTSFGILGTFMGLVWGLKGFNPVSYEAMASSITSLIDGIKVAFVTSIFGIALSMTFSYWLRGAVTSVSESLDDFLDKYYLCAVSPTDATAMNHVLANQKEQIRALDQMGDNLSDHIARSLTEHVDPVMERMNHTLETFTDTVTLNNQELLERIAGQVSEAMRREFFAEFAEMRVLLKETNKEQREYLKFMAAAQEQLNESVRTCTEQLKLGAKSTADHQAETMKELNVQQEHLTQFVDYMTQVLEKMSALNSQTAKTAQLALEQVDKISRLTEESMQAAASARASVSAAQGAAEDAAKNAGSVQVENKIEDLDALTTRLDQMIDLMQKQMEAPKSRRGLFR